MGSEACEVCALIGQLMGTRERGDGFNGSGATAAVDICPFLRGGISLCAAAVACAANCAH
jgi:hypothetical protein